MIRRGHFKSLCPIAPARVPCQGQRIRAFRRSVLVKAHSRLCSCFCFDVSLRTPVSAVRTPHGASLSIRSHPHTHIYNRSRSLPHPHPCAVCVVFAGKPHPPPHTLGPAPIAHPRRGRDGAQSAPASAPTTMSWRRPSARPTRMPPRAASRCRATFRWICRCGRGGLPCGDGAKRRCTLSCAAVWRHNGVAVARFPWERGIAATDGVLVVCHSCTVEQERRCARTRTALRTARRCVGA